MTTMRFVHYKAASCCFILMETSQLKWHPIQVIVRGAAPLKDAAKNIGDSLITC